MKYSLAISARDTDRSSYYCISFGPEVTVLQGTYHFLPTAAARSMFAVWPGEVQAQFPPSSEISGSATLATSADFISGEILISPALAVPVTFTLWGREQVGDITVAAGETVVPFRFDVPS